MAQEYVVTILNKDIEFAPDILTEILQNVRTIIGTVLGTVPLDRSLGLTPDVTDLPINVLQARISSAVAVAIADGEPRVQVNSITFDSTDLDAMDGRTNPRVKLSIKEGALNG